MITEILQIDSKNLGIFSLLVNCISCVTCLFDKRNNFCLIQYFYLIFLIINQYTTVLQLLYLRIFTLLWISKFKIHKKKS